MAHGDAVLVCGVRTPFTKAFEQQKEKDAVALGCDAVRGLLAHTHLAPQHIDQVIMGHVVFQNGVANIAREMVLDLELHEQTVGHTVSMACASGLLSLVQVNCVSYTFPYLLGVFTEAYLHVACLRDVGDRGKERGKQGGKELGGA